MAKLDKKHSPLIEVYLGQSGAGKTFKLCEAAKEYSKMYNLNILACDSRGQVSEHFGCELIKSRKRLIEVVDSPKFLACYQPGMENFSEESDIEFFFAISLSLNNGGVVIFDELDYSLSSVKMNSLHGFRQLAASCRTRGLILLASTFRCRETPVKLRSIAIFKIGRITEPGDLKYLSMLSGFDEEEIKNLPDRTFITLPR